MVRRSKQEVIFTVLREIERGEERPTKIMYATNVSWTQFCQILDRLLSDEFIVEKIDKSKKRSKKSYSITEKGERALDTYRKDRILMGHKIDLKWTENAEEIKWILGLLGLGQSERWCIMFSEMSKITGPFAVTSLISQLGQSSEVPKLIDELKKKSIITKYKMVFPENWDDLSITARRRRMKSAGIPQGWHKADYLVFDQEKLKELISESVENILSKLFVGGYLIG